MHPVVRKIPFFLSGACLFASFLGIVIYSVYVHREGPVVVVNQFLGVLLSTLLLVFSAQPFVYKYYQDANKRTKIVSLIFSLVVLTVCTFLFFGYCIGKRGDGIAWTPPLIFINLFNFYILLKQYRNLDDESHLYNVVGEDEHPSKFNVSRAATLFKVFNGIVKVIALIFLICMLGGAYTLAYGYPLYGPRGKFVHVRYDDGREQKIHYLCEGPLTDKPTFWFEVGGGHTLCDFYGIQQFLTQNNYRSCIYDRPGFGWSDYILPNQPYWYEKMINGTGERGPFVIAGWAAGGEITYPFVSQNPHLVHSWVLLDVAYPDEEWESAQYRPKRRDKRKE